MEKAGFAYKTLIESPLGGEHRRPTPLRDLSANGLKPQKLSDRRWASCRLARSRQDFGNSWRFLAILGFFGASSPGLSKTSPGAFKIEPGTLQDEPQDLPNRARGLPRRAPGPQKWSPEASKTAFLKDLYLKKAQVGALHSFFGPKWPNLGPSWLPKTLPNRAQNVKKSMLKKASFFESIFEGFGPRFWTVFGRFFGPKMHAKSDLKKSARQAKSIVKTNTKSMSAPLRQCSFRAKIDEK